MPRKPKSPPATAPSTPEQMKGCSLADAQLAEAKKESEMEKTNAPMAQFDLGTIMELVALAQQYGPEVIQIIMKLRDLFKTRMVGGAAAGLHSAEMPDDRKQLCEQLMNHLNEKRTGAPS